VGLFNSVDERTSRDYLASAPPGPRTDVLASSCVIQIRDLPVASRSHFGQSINLPDLEPASQLVRHVMRQDRDLSAWVARKAIVTLKSVMGSRAMSGDIATDFPLGLAAVGLQVGPSGSVIPRPDGPGPSEQDPVSASGFGAIVIGLLVLLTSAPNERTTSPAWRLYEDLYTGASGDDVEDLAYDVTAWVSVLLARLFNAGHIGEGLDLFGPNYRQAPPLRQPGWYPNPANFGGIMNGDAVFQRFWEGSWTDRVRVREGGRWAYDSISLHASPIDLGCPR
jgi:hypothetical protein